jgi:hypothetical protein
LEIPAKNSLFCFRREFTPPSTEPGSGSTLRAAQATGRVCRGVEIDPLDADVIVRRFEAAT